jgi:hypothetical protein
MNRNPLLQWAMLFQVAGLCAAPRNLHLKSAPLAGSAGRRRLPNPVVKAAAVGVCLAVLIIRRKPLPVKAALSLKSP